MAKNTTPVIDDDQANAPAMPKTNGNSGTRPASKKARNVATAARIGCGCPPPARIPLQHQLKRRRLVGGDRTGRSLQHTAPQPLAPQDLADLAPLALGVFAQRAALHRARPARVIQLGLGAGIIPGRHGKSVRQHIGQPQRHDDYRRQPGPGHPRDNRKGRYRSVDAAIHHIPQTAPPRRCANAGIYLGLGMPVFRLAATMAGVRAPGIAPDQIREARPQGREERAPSGRTARSAPVSPARSHAADAPRQRAAGGTHPSPQPPRARSARH